MSALYTSLAALFERFNAVVCNFKTKFIQIDLWQYPKNIPERVVQSFS